MISKRIVPCLDIKNGRTVKGINFKSLRDAGDPVELARIYANSGADELVFLDITATEEARGTLAKMVYDVAEAINIPFTVGGGIRSVEDVDILLKNGADKISINSSAIRNPSLVNELSEKFGSQCVVVAIDAKKIEGQWMVHLVEVRCLLNWIYLSGLKKLKSVVLVNFCLLQWITMEQRMVLLLKL